MRGSPVFSMLTVLFCTALFGEPVSDPDLFFNRQRGTIDVAARGVGGAGAALPWNVQSVTGNPSLLYSIRNTTAPISRSVGLGYGLDSLFDRYSIPLGTSWSRRMMAYALNLRAMSNGNDLRQYEATATICHRLWGLAHPKGPFDIGMNLRYAYARGEKRILDTLYSTRLFVDSLGRPFATSGGPVPLGFDAATDIGRFRANRVSVDVGVFKQEFASHVDVGLAVTNIFGIRWGGESPDTVEQVVLGRDTASKVYYIDTLRSYVASYGEYPRESMGAKNAVIDLGVNFKINIPGNSFSLCFPIGAQVYGVFDPDVRDLYSFRGGMQLHLLTNFFFRMGYSFAPRFNPQKPAELKNGDNYTLGASVLLPGFPAVADVFFYGRVWGMYLSFEY